MNNGFLYQTRLSIRQSLAACVAQLDNQRLRQHFRFVERELRSREVHGLPESTRLARSRNLDRLREYGRRGVFPRNYDYRNQQPCFIDRTGTVCAVAHLMIESGHKLTAQRIVAAANYVRVSEMPFPELNTWGAEAGLSRKELIRIQPYYPHALTADEVELYRLINLGAEYVLMLMAAGGINLIISAVNTINLIRKRRGWLGPMLGVVAGGSLMVLVIFALQLLGAGNRLAEPLAGRWWVSDDPAPYWNIVSTYLTFLAGPAFGVGLVSVTLSLWTRFRTKVEAWLQTGNL